MIAQPPTVATFRALRYVLLLAAAATLLASYTVPIWWVVLGLGGVLAVALTLRFPIAGMALLAVSVPWGSGFALPSSSFPLTSTDLIAAALTAAWLVSAVSERRNPFATRMWLLYIALYVGAILLSVSQATDRHASEREIVKWVEMAAVYCSAAWFLRGRRDLAHVVGWLIAAGVTQALLGYVQLAFALGPAAFLTRSPFLRAYGTFDQPNPYAGYLNTILPFALALSWLSPSPRARTWSRLSAVLLAGALIASESRGALLAGMLASAIVVGTISPRWKVMAWIATFAGITGAWLASYGLVPLGPFTKLLDAVGLGGVSFGNVTDANFSTVERAAHWLAGVRMFASHPLLGVGIGNYAAAYPHYHPRGWYDPLEHAHNYYINIAAEAGVAGLVSYLLLAGSALWYSYVIVRRECDPLLRAIGLGVLGALVATDFHNLFDVLYVHGVAALLGLMMAFLPVIARESARRTGLPDTAQTK